jgi:hypothetical protein
MSGSYPTIQDSLSDTQKEFMACVEMHLDPPEDDEVSRYRVEAVFRHDDPETELPGNAIRFTISVDESDYELMMRRHTIEFLELGDDDYPNRVGHVLHMMKRVEAALGQYYWTETQFEVVAPDVPSDRISQAEVEEEVKVFVDRVRALDRGRKLVPAP